MGNNSREVSMSVTKADIRAAREGIQKVAFLDGIFSGGEAVAGRDVGAKVLTKMQNDPAFWQQDAQDWMAQQNINTKDPQAVQKAKAYYFDHRAKKLIAETMKQYKTDAAKAAEGGMITKQEAVTGGMGLALGALLGGVFGGAKGAAIGSLLGGLAMWAMEKFDLTPEFAKGFINDTANAIPGLGDKEFDQAKIEEVAKSAAAKIGVPVEEVKQSGETGKVTTTPEPTEEVDTTTGATPDVVNGETPVEAEGRMLTEEDLIKDPTTITPATDTPAPTKGDQGRDIATEEGTGEELDEVSASMDVDLYKQTTPKGADPQAEGFLEKNIKGNKAAENARNLQMWRSVYGKTARPEDPAALLELTASVPDKYAQEWKNSRKAAVAARDSWNAANRELALMKKSGYPAAQIQEQENKIKQLAIARDAAVLKTSNLKKTSDYIRGLRNTASKSRLDTVNAQIAEYNKGLSPFKSAYEAASKTHKGLYHPRMGRRKGPRYDNPNWLKDTSDSGKRTEADTRRMLDNAANKRDEYLLTNKAKYEALVNEREALQSHKSKNVFQQPTYEAPKPPVKKTNARGRVRR
jgi:hypothetical protein